MKQGYQPKSCNLKNIVPPSVSTKVKPKKEDYTWEDLDKAWWEGFDTCKAKSGEANIKLNDELEKLKKQLEELPDKWCRNKDDYCPHLADLEKENAELKAQLESERDLPAIVYMQGAEKQKKKDEDQLTKAKEIIRDLLGCLYSVEYDRVSDLEQAEQFLKDNEEEK